MESRPSIDGRRHPLLDRINESCQFGTKRFLRRKFELVHRTFLSFYRVAIGNVPILERLDLVLRHIVITHRGRIGSHNGYFAQLARGIVSGFYRREYRGTFASIVFQNNQRFIIHSPTEKITQHRMNTPRRRAEEEVEQIDKMNAVGKSHARIVTRTLEAAESRPQHLQSAKSSLGNGIAHPERRRVEPENMANLQNQSALLCEL